MQGRVRSIDVQTREIKLITERLQRRNKLLDIKEDEEVFEDDPRALKEFNPVMNRGRHRP